jgi:membrane-bound lytic murein transglycosylase D
LLLLCGCLQPLHITSVLHKNDSVLSRKTSGSSSAEPEEKGLNTNQKSAPSGPPKLENSPGTEEKIKISESNDTIKSNDIIDCENDDATSSPAIKIQTSLDEALDFCQVSQDFWQKGELERAIEALDQAYSLILNVDTYNNPKLIQQKEDLRFLISKRILEIYASRNIVVNGNHNAIPMVMNKHIEAELSRFTKGREKNFFINSYKRSGTYRPQIVAALKKAGLPVELSWIPLIESGFKPKALSKARALGLWQFIPSTGYKFGLKRDMYIDERLDPVKATKAAIAYLKELHQIFGDWATVLAAYNCGEGRVLRVIRSQNINYLDNFWDLYERLPQETARYVPKFLATLHIVKNPERYELDSICIDPPLEYETVTISRQVHLRNVGKKIGVSEKTLVGLNPELRYKILPNEKYSLRVPLGKGKMLLAKLDEIPLSYRPQRAFVYHRVKPGETLSTIAKRYHSSVRRIARVNNINKSNFIVAGKKLKIPKKGTIIYRSKKPVKKNYRQPSTHVVRRGDSLWIIAKRYGTTTQKIQELNNLSTTNLHIGQVLKMPGLGNGTPAGDVLKIYQVKRGDSPFMIAQRYKMPLERFLHINSLKPGSKIYPNQKLYVE